MKQQSAVLACTGAVIGAGFASGREVVMFFSRYGRFAILLIGLTAAVMTVLCAVCMRAAKVEAESENWNSLLRKRFLGQWGSYSLLVLTAGAMLAAAGHVAEMMLPIKGAYQLGLLGTLFAARWIGGNRMKGLEVCSAFLMMTLLCALVGALISIPPAAVKISLERDRFSAAESVLAAVGYASMNMTLAMGVVCQSAKQTACVGRTSAVFGLLIWILLLLSHAVYSRAGLADSEPFPMVTLLSRFGQKGFYFAGLLLYLSIMTTLASVLYALRMAVEKSGARPSLCWLVWAGMPLAVSRIGFASIVDRLYVPAGLFCLGCVFVPLAVGSLRQR